MRPTGPHDEDPLVCLIQGWHGEHVVMVAQRSWRCAGSPGYMQALPEPHHVEAITDNLGWGWRCLTCNAIAPDGFRTITEAEEAGDEHARAAAMQATPEQAEQR